MKDMELLFEGWRGSLKEQGKGDIGLCLWASKDDLLIYDGDALIHFIDTNIKKRQQVEKHKPDFGYILDEYGLIETTQIFIASMNLVGKKHGTCMGANEVGGSAVHPKWQGKKMGRLLYGLAMIHLYPTPLMPDRRSVSTKAQWVWKSLGANPKIEKLPPEKKPYKGVFDDPRVKETPPKKDDCKTHGPEDLDRAYRYTSKKNEKLYNRMKQNHKKTIAQIKKMGVLKPPTDDELREITENLFIYVYY